MCKESFSESDRSEKNSSKSNLPPITLPPNENAQSSSSSRQNDLSNPSDHQTESKPPNPNPSDTNFSSVQQPNHSLIPQYKLEHLVEPQNRPENCSDTFNQSENSSKYSNRSAVSQASSSNCILIPSKGSSPRAQLRPRMNIYDLLSQSASISKTRENTLNKVKRKTEKPINEGLVSIYDESSGYGTELSEYSMIYSSD